MPFWKAKSAEAAGTLAPDGLSRAVFIMDGAMRAGTVLADLVLKESQIDDSIWSTDYTITMFGFDFQQGQLSPIPTRGEAIICENIFGSYSHK